MNAMGSSTSTAVVAAQLGGPEVLHVQSWEVPPPAPDEVRVRVGAAGISFADLLMVHGIHPERRRPPFVPGWDVVAHDDVVARCRELTDGRGVDAAFDGIGATATSSLRAVRPGGRMVWFGMVTMLSGGQRDLPKIAETAGNTAAVFARNLRPGVHAGSQPRVLRRLR